MKFGVGDIVKMPTINSSCFGGPTKIIALRKSVMRGKIIGYITEFEKDSFEKDGDTNCNYWEGKYFVLVKKANPQLFLW